MAQSVYETASGITIYTTTEVTATNLPVSGIAGDQLRTMARLVVPVNPGDILDITGRMRVTNDIGPIKYAVGIGYHYWAYDVDDGLDVHPWWRIGPSNGENVTPVPYTHHMPMHLEDVYEIPAEWVPGHQIVIVFRADAHSTGWNRNTGKRVDGVLTTPDKITVDVAYGRMTIRKYEPKVV
jgi:hypothetical protein